MRAQKYERFLKTSKKNAKKSPNTEKFQNLCTFYLNLSPQNAESCAFSRSSCAFDCGW